MKYILVVLFIGIASHIVQIFDSWLLNGWLQYFCGSIVTYFLINDYDKHECEDEDE